MRRILHLLIFLPFLFATPACAAPETVYFKSADGKTKKMKVELFTWEKLDHVAKVKKAFGIK